MPYLLPSTYANEDDASVKQYNDLQQGYYVDVGVHERRTDDSIEQ